MILASLILIASLWLLVALLVVGACRTASAAEPA
jgi:hypothetical protein